MRITAIFPKNFNGIQKNRLKRNIAIGSTFWEKIITVDKMSNTILSDVTSNDQCFDVNFPQRIIDD